MSSICRIFVHSLCSGLLSLIEQLTCLAGVALEHGHHALGVQSLRRVACLAEIAFSTFKVAALHACACGIDVGRRVVGIHAHGGLHNLC